MAYLIKELNPGSQIFVLHKTDDVKVYDGSIVSISQPRLDNTQVQQGGFPLANTTIKNVIDVTYSVGGKNYTDTINETDTMFQTSKLGGVALVAMNNDDILRELRASLKLSQDHIAKTAWHEKRIKQCEKLIAERDLAFAERKATNERISKLEDNMADITKMLSSISSKLDKK